MEGYPYMQKVASSFPPYQETAANGDKSTASNVNFEPPMLEQLMPSGVVAASPYPGDAAAYNNIENSNTVPATTTSTSGTNSVDPYSSSVGDNLSSSQSVPQKQPPAHAPAVQNGQQMTDSTEEAVEPSVCNGTSSSKENTDASIPGDSSIAPLNAEEQTAVNDKTDASIKEVVVNESSKPTETRNPNKPNDDSAISNETPVGEGEPPSVSNKPEPDNTAPAKRSKTNDITSVDEKLDDSNHDEDEEYSSDTVISDSCPTDSGNVSSLFKNVVLVQAETITAEETGSDAASEPGRHSLSESETLDPIVASSVEDIGREDENEMFDADLLIDETGDNYAIIDGVTAGQMGRTVALDAPIIDPNDAEEEAENGDGDEENHCRKNDSNGNRKTYPSFAGAKNSKRKESVSVSSDEESLKEGSIRPTSQKCQKSNSRKKRPKVSNDDPFGSCASSSSEDVPNDMYFGTPDRVFTVSTKLHWQRQKQKRSKYYARAKATDRYDDDASSDEEDDDNDDDEKHAQRRAKRAEEIARLKLPAYQQQQLQQLVLKKHPKRDRFYDRSQDIPNDIYFGNVKVPLHILHASSSSSSEEEPWPGGSVKSSAGASCYHKKNHHSEYRHRKESAAYTKSSNYRYSRSTSSRAESTSSQGGTRSVHRMKEYLKMAGFRHMRYQKLWQGCETNHDRAEAILRFLQAHGLQGEPTDEKCRELRKEIQLKKEVEVLDTSVIIGSGEGRVTRQRAKKVSETTAAETSANLPPEQQCLQKDEQTVVDPASAASVPSETVEQETECKQQQQEQVSSPEENDPSEKGVEQALPTGDLNHSNSPPNE
ncbi:HIRA-interacting protein 3-like isoform X1 [Anopheles stephensi]|uniref:HIRA-interacting protein 3-like isoform X1 n=1 Tax=Anopheles stephensi TaxID=30069 RepID=UPI0016588249|nr:HIRA-interacting protein 3-like isoform X1 [Anopheles stephensi]XP_035891106.1 HIRA-interacting protein 3-like isoform X1 [Anopheles stephensi]XP_035891107.1 HIRA-interacting protein 3-like isoform X1 [Anopheles stephensi]